MRTKSTKVNVREIKTEHPQGYKWRVFFPNGGGIRRSRFFKTETEAKEFAKGKQAELGQSGSKFGVLSEAERSAVEQWRAIRALAARDKIPAPTITEVIAAEADRWKAALSRQTVEDTADRLIAMKKAEGCGKGFVSTLEGRLNRFCRDHEGRAIAGITTTEINAWLMGMKHLDRATVRNYRKAAGMLFGLAVAEGMIGNPVDAAYRPKLPDKVAGVLKPNETKRLFAKLDPVAVPFVAIGLFAGLRVAEIHRLQWEHFDWDAGEINLPPSITKTRQGREVAIQPALAAWLKDHKQNTGLVVSEERKALRELIVDGANKAKVKLPKNVWRHTFATAHLLAFRKAGETCLQLGHNDSPRLMNRHYRGCMTKGEAAEHWEVMP